MLDVETQESQPLVPDDADARLALAVWSPAGDAIAYVDAMNNLSIRKLNEANEVQAVTTDGGADLFYGIPDWVYEEEVFSGNQAMWWSQDGGYLAFLRTNETEVPEYPLQYFVSRPSGETPEEGLENYPELDFIKYPKAGAPNPVVDLRFYDLKKKDTFSITVADDFPDDDRLITEVVWAGDKVLVRGTNRESDVLKMALVNVGTREGRVVREVNVTAIDGGWFEVVRARCEYLDVSLLTPPRPRKRHLCPRMLARTDLKMGMSTKLFTKVTIIWRTSPHSIPTSRSF